MPRTRHSMDRRLAGILVPVSSIRGERDIGIGDTSSLREFVNFAADCGFGFVQVLPVNETGPDNSPYNAISSVALEPMTLDCTPEGLSDLDEEDFREVLEGVDREALDAGAVDYAAVRPLKQALLRRAFGTFVESVHGRVDARSDEFDNFCQEEAGWLNDYCLFRVLMDREDGSPVWREWREEFRDRDSALRHLAELPEDEVDAFDREMRYYAYVQWVAWGQWRRAAEHAASRDVALMGDIPFGVSLHSVDVWANRAIFDLDWYGGAPPERLFKDDEFVCKWGQNWGIPLYRWDELERSGYAWWMQRVRKTTELFSMFRVDHALGFYRIYSFPWSPARNAEFLPLDIEEAAARCGGRRPGFRPRPDDTEEDREANRREGEALLRMLLEAAEGNEVVAEDLGTVPDYVRPSLEDLGIPGMKVPQWEFTDGRVTSGLLYPACSFATYATHDHFPLRAQWEAARAALEEARSDSPGADEARQFLESLCVFAGVEREDGAFPPYDDRLRERLVRELCLSNSDRVAFLITDLLGGVERFTVPGVMDGSNWSHRLDCTARELTADEQYWELREMLKKVLKETARRRTVGGS